MNITSAFTGSAVLAAFDETAGRIAESTASILRRADVDFAVLGVTEACCGDFVRRLGDEGLFQKLAGMNIETLKKYDFDFHPDPLPSLL